MQQQELESIYQSLSSQRLGKCGLNQALAIDIYRWNIALSEAMYPLLHTIEVALRNQLHNSIAQLTGDQNWIANRNEKIMERFNEYWQRKVDDHIRSLRKKGKLDEGHLVAEMSFGFWTALMSGPFEYKNFLWPRIKESVFPNAHGHTIDQLRRRFDQIRSIRNRVFHYRSIWHWSDLNQKHDLIVDAIKWLNPALLHFVEIDRFNEVYARRPNDAK